MSRSKQPATRRAALDATWIKPHWLERQLDPRSPAFVPRSDASAVVNVTGRSWTTLGTVASDARAIVDPRGLLTPGGAGWSLDWWIGGEDRWHFPSREAAVRQQLVADAPVVETSMRIPGGDAVQRVFAVSNDLVVVELTNATPTPIAVGIAVRPYDPTGLSPVFRIRLEDRTVVVDGRRAVQFEKRPQRSATSTFATGDAAARILAESFDADPGREVRCGDGLATATYLFPLAHRQTLRFVVAMSGRPPGESLDEVPDPETVVRSWHAQTSNRGARLVLPEGRLASAVEANRRFLLLFDGGADVARTMDRFGFHKDSAEVLASFPRRGMDAPSVLAAAAEHWRLTGSLDAIDGETVVKAVRMIQRGAGPVDGLADGAALLRGFGLDRVADECDRAVASPTSRPAPAPRLFVGAAVVDDAGGTGLDPRRTLQLADDEVDAGDRVALERLSWLLDVASPTWTWPSSVHPQLGTGSGGDGHDARVAAAFLSLVRRLLVRETDDGGLALCSMLPDAWAGQSLEVHGVPTHVGVVSFAVRYHGDRPALLWDLAVRPGAGPVRLTAPGLDPAWSSTEAKGEALLAAAAPRANEGPVAVEGSFS